MKPRKVIKIKRMPMQSTSTIKISMANVGDLPVETQQITLSTQPNCDTMKTEEGCDESTGGNAQPQKPVVQEIKRDIKPLERKPRMPLKAKYGTQIDLFSGPNRVEEMLLEDSEETSKFRKKNSKVSV